MPTRPSLRAQVLEIKLEGPGVGKIASVPASVVKKSLPEFTPAKMQQTESDAKISPPPAVAEKQIEAPLHDEVATSAQTASDQVAPSAGIAFPQHNTTMPARRRLWSFPERGPSMPNEQMLYQAEMQRQTQLAAQMGSQAARGKFEAQLITLLREVKVQAACQVVLQASGGFRLRCDEDQDSNAVRAVLAQSGDPPPVLGDASWLVIDLKPSSGGGSNTESHRTNQAPES